MRGIRRGAVVVAILSMSPVAVKNAEADTIGLGQMLVVDFDIVRHCWPSNGCYEQYPVNFVLLDFPAVTSLPPTVAATASLYINGVLLGSTEVLQYPWGGHPEPYWAFSDFSFPPVAAAAFPGTTRVDLSSAVHDNTGSMILTMNSGTIEFDRPRVYFWSAGSCGSGCVRLLAPMVQPEDVRGEVQAVPVPEPASLSLLGMGLVGLRAWKKRRT